MVVLTYVFGSSDPWFVILYLISDLCLVLCCDIYRSTLISIMYPACMITVHDRKSRALHISSARLVVQCVPTRMARASYIDAAPACLWSAATLLLLAPVDAGEETTIAEQHCTVRQRV